MPSEKESPPERCERLFASLKHDAKSIVTIEGKRYCWASGISTKPMWWQGPWWLQVAHIHSGAGSGVRVDDRRAVVCLCPLLHELHVANSGRMPEKKIGGKIYPTIDNSHTVWIKSVFDPEYYEPKFLEMLWNGNPPSPKVLPEFWLTAIKDNIGLTFRRSSVT